ncbi:MAG: pyrimidine reductase family protein [Acidimicrobiales bacterium]
MRQLWPDPGEVDDVAGLIASDPRPSPAGRPWLLVSMVASLDGAISVEGRSGALGGPADKLVFSALRGVADIVLAGAGTVRAEGYGPPRPTDAVRAGRAARGQTKAPRVAVITRSLDLDLSSALFVEAEAPPLVITCAAADRSRQDAVRAVADLVVAGDDDVDLATALAQLHEREARVVTCEGGPSLNGDLLAADLVDEWNLTVSPLLVAGDAGRASRGPTLSQPRGMRLARLLESDGTLLTRWVRDRAEPT